MSGLPWFKCYPRDFNDGMVGLTLEERGAYVTILNVIYARGEAVPDDASYFRALLCCSPKTWAKIRASLLVKKKLFAVTVNTEPCLMNQRAALEIAVSEEKSQKFSDAGRRGGQNSTKKRNEINPPEEARLEPASSDTDTDTEKSSVTNVTAQIEAIDLDPDAQAWALAVELLTKRGKLSERQARAFFGSILKRHSLAASEMLVALIHAEDSGTLDLQPYLTAAAQAQRGLRVVHARGPPSSSELAIAAREEGRRRLLAEDEDGDAGRNYQRN